MKSEEVTMKVVGKRKYTTPTNDAFVLQETMLDFRRGRGFIPKGVYKFKTFEEAQQWMTDQIVKNSPAIRH